jgi:hypothetical protein
MSVQPESPNDQTFGQYISGIRGELNEYVRARVELARTGMQEQVATQGGKFGSLFIVILLATLFLIFGLLCLALWLGRMYNDTVLGFALVGLGLLLMSLLAFLLRKFLADIIAERIAGQILSTSEKDSTSSDANANQPITKS